VAFKFLIKPFVTTTVAPVNAGVIIHTHIPCSTIVASDYMKNYIFFFCSFLRDISVCWYCHIYLYACLFLIFLFIIFIISGLFAISSLFVSVALDSVMLLHLHFPTLVCAVCLSFRYPVVCIFIIIDIIIIIIIIIIIASKEWDERYK
jgi:hypothetical protein